ncbi:protein of unknown function [Shewanella benthica]|uniref:Uncharacterized protein n=1 Tax=Shewanella benthica TaxID=43661 RepID=A0A330M4Q9_9GAMM|nr:protein of unknown function [Shewanella benthica]
MTLLSTYITWTIVESNAIPTFSNTENENENENESRCFQNNQFYPSSFEKLYIDYTYFNHAEEARHYVKEAHSSQSILCDCSRRCR